MMDQSEFVRKIASKIDKCSWFLGAGFSASANLPTANDIIWDLKKKYFCSEENQNIRENDIQILPIRKKVQEFCESRNFPAEYEADEYSFYFDLLFGNNEEDQRRYLAEILSSDRITLSIGHRVLAALMEEGLTKVVYTTNFDKVLENAYSHISGKNLGSYQLEGADACTAALNNDEFPLYIKAHGDFQYKRLANLADHLLKADEEIKKCFLASTSRFGLIVTGYSGRDKSIMNLLFESLDVTNAFSHGFYWTVLRNSYVNPNVLELINTAKLKGIEAEIVEVDSFDSMMTRLWRNLPSIPKHLDLKVERASERSVNIPIPKASKDGQLIRFNFLPLKNITSECFTLDTEFKLDWNGVSDIRKLAREKIILWIDERVHAWGNLADIKSFVPGIKKIETTDISEKIEDLKNHKSLQSAVEELICRSLVVRKELLARKNSIIIGKQHFASENLNKLKTAVGELGGELPETTIFKDDGEPELVTPVWCHCLQLRVKQLDRNYILILSPDIWISPSKTRKNHIDFLKRKRSNLKNDNFDLLISAWIETIFPEKGPGQVVLLKPFFQTDLVGSDGIKTTTRTSFSRKVK